MRTLCFLMEKPEALVAVAVTLRQLALLADHVHVQSPEGAGLRHRLSDVADGLDACRLRCRRQGVLGGLAGLLLALWLVIWQPQGLTLGGLVGFLGTSLFLGSFGAWLGLMLARSVEDGAPDPGQEALLSGRLRLLIAVPSIQQARALREFLSAAHPELVFEVESGTHEPSATGVMPMRQE